MLVLVEIKRPPSEDTISSKERIYGPVFIGFFTDNIHGGRLPAK
jgi:hypothetical protein